MVISANFSNAKHIHPDVSMTYFLLERFSPEWKNKLKEFKGVIKLKINKPIWKSLSSMRGEAYFKNDFHKKKCLWKTLSPLIKV